MRELVFKNLTSEDKRRKDLYIYETVERENIKTTTQRHSTYIIREHNKFNSPEELMNLQKSSQIENDKRHIFIFKKHDSKLSKDSFICDVVGRFYAVINDEVYSIAFKHTFDVEFLFKAHI